MSRLKYKRSYEAAPQIWSPQWARRPLPPPPPPPKDGKQKSNERELQSKQTERHKKQGKKKNINKRNG